MKFLRLMLLLSLLSVVIAACGADTATVQPTAGSVSQASPATEATAAPADSATAYPAADVSPEASPDTDPTAESSPEADPEPEVSPTVPAGTFVPTEGKLIIYSGRSENLVGPLVEMFEQDTGVEAEVRYGDTAELAAQIREEGDNSPADVFFGQDAGALGSLSERFITLEDEIVDKVEARFRSPNDTWVGTSGRARVLVYNTAALTETDLPASILDLTDAKWAGKVGWAPTNGSFQAFVTALRLSKGEDAAKAWLEGMIANDVKVYANNAAIVQAVADGEIDLGLVNHYYLFALKKDKGEVNAANYYFPNGDIGSLVNVAGVGILKTGKNQQAAEEFVEYLLAQKAQEYFAEQTFEYPLADGVQPSAAVKPLSEITTPDLDLSNLGDLQGTLELLEDVGAVQ
jgi:iron(III) transport system substrate-binding protein